MIAASTQFAPPFFCQQNVAKSDFSLLPPPRKGEAGMTGDIFFRLLLLLNQIQTSEHTHQAHSHKEKSRKNIFFSFFFPLSPHLNSQSPSCSFSVWKKRSVCVICNMGFVCKEKPHKEGGGQRLTQAEKRYGDLTQNMYVANLFLLTALTTTIQ